MMRERQIRKLQKNRHLAEIGFTLLQNPTFKNLSRADRYRMAKLIYKAELIEIEIKSKDMSRTLDTFQEMIRNITDQLVEDDDDDDLGPENPFK
jgi:nicotinic acid mononucleotide adenylyltransferase